MSLIELIVYKTCFWVIVFIVPEYVFIPAGGWVTSAPRKMTGSLKTLGRIEGTKMLLTPPSC